MTKARHKPIFYDERKIRWKIFLLLISLITVITLSIYIYTINSIIHYKNNHFADRYNDSGQFEYANPTEKYKNTKPIPINENFINSAFYVLWDEKSNKSLLDNYSSLDYVFMEWLYLHESEGIKHYDNNKEDNISSFLDSENKREIIIPMIHNYNATEDRFDFTLALDLIDTDKESEKMAVDIIKYIVENRYSGIAIDFEDIPYNKQYIYQRFIQKLYSKTKSESKKLFVILPFARNDINYYQFSKNSDHIVLMAYDYSWNKSDNGPIAPHFWIQNYIRNLTSYISPSKIILGIGAYGYDWNENEKKAVPIDFEGALTKAKEYKQTFKIDPKSLNTYLQYETLNGDKHTIWILDAISNYNSVLLANNTKLSGVALWRIGSEDSKYWDIYKDKNNILASLDALQKPEFKYDLAIYGKGSVYTANTTQKNGYREVELDTNGYITSFDFKTLPTTYELKKLSGDYQKRIALTFDDGPSDEYTEKILKILDENNVKASFFVIGSKVNSNPSIIKEIYTKGHDIGNHTYLHSNIRKLSDSQSKLELNATQRVLESYLDVNTRLFRAPYGLDTIPDTKREIGNISELSNLGYYSAGYDIDTKDWLIKDKEAIKSSIIKGVEDKHGGIVLLHDGGGDREETVKALAEVIPELREKGYTFVTISSLIGIPQTDIMPLSSAKELPSLIDNAGFLIQNKSYNIFSFIIVFSIFVGFIRILVILSLALIQKVRDLFYKTNKSYSPSTTVIIPSWNEEKVIPKTVENLLSMKFTKFRIIVVDDGSSDKTYEILTKKFGKKRRLRIFKIPNGGKSNAINYAISRCRSEVIIVQDADTLLDDNSIPLLIRHFDDSRIGAVAGNVKVGNRKSLLAKLQAVEYITSQNLDRRAFHLTNSISVVPGAIGAWRRKYVKMLGGFNSDTLAEDAELTYAMLANGYKVINEPNAIAYTEAPENMKDFMKQRFRWMFGTLQVSIKYIKYILSFKHKSFGWITIPNVLFYNIIFPLLAPFVDIFTVLVLASAIWQQISNDDLKFEGFHFIVIFSVIFLITELIVALIAFLLESKESKRMLWVFPIQKIIYKYILLIVSIKTLLTAVKGPAVNWEKKIRTANVELPFPKNLNN